MSFWDDQAATFDEAPDHGMLDPDVRAAWRDVLLAALPPGPGLAADLGCGTGTVAVLLAEAGFEVRGVDLSARMVAAASAKVAGLPVEIAQGDAADPPLSPGTFDVVFARHVLWALPEPDAVLGRWVRLLRPNGRLVLVEGFWETGGGITAARCQEMVARHRETVEVRHLTDPRLWGRAVTDERYLVLSPR